MWPKDGRNIFSENFDECVLSEGKVIPENLFCFELRTIFFNRTVPPAGRGRYPIVRACIEVKEHRFANVGLGVFVGIC